MLGNADAWSSACVASTDNGVSTVADASDGSWSGTSIACGALVSGSSPRLHCHRGGAIRVVATSGSSGVLSGSGAEGSHRPQRGEGKLARQQRTLAGVFVEFPARVGTRLLPARWLRYRPPRPTPASGARRSASCFAAVICQRNVCSCASASSPAVNSTGSTVDRLGFRVGKILAPCRPSPHRPAMQRRPGWQGESAARWEGASGLRDRGGPIRAPYCPQRGHATIWPRLATFFTFSRLGRWCK